MNSTMRGAERWDASVGRWVAMPEAAPKASPLQTLGGGAVGHSKARPPAYSSLPYSSTDRGWQTIFGGGEGYMGGFQRDDPLPWDKSLAFFAVYACITQIAGDIGKLCMLLMERSDSGVWQKAAPNAAYDPVLRKPNHFQTMQQFVEHSMISKLTHGNSYILLDRDASNKVRREYVLDPHRVTPLVAPNGDVFYELANDDLSRLPYASVFVPASEIIHDRMNCLFHPLIGISPLYACGLAARQGLAIQKNSAAFFSNMSRPSGVLTAPAEISESTAKRIKDEWEANFRREQIGKVAVLGDGLKYEQMSVTPEDAEIVEQLKMSAETVCSAFGVPRFMIEVGNLPGNQNTEALWQLYYTKTLQKLIESFERLQDDGLGLDHAKYRTEFDLDDLLRMDSKTQAEVEGILVQRGIGKPNEARAKFGRGPVLGGDTPYLQQQNYSLAALQKRDSSEDPFGSAPAHAPEPPAEPDAEQEAARAAETMRVRAMEDELAARRYIDGIRKQRQAAQA